jgi:hypothetical protein
VWAQLSSGRRKKLISLIGDRLWSFFATLGHPVCIGRKEQDFKQKKLNTIFEMRILSPNKYD